MYLWNIIMVYSTHCQTHAINTLRQRHTEGEGREIPQMWIQLSHHFATLSPNKYMYVVSNAITMRPSVICHWPSWWRSHILFIKYGTIDICFHRAQVHVCVTLHHLGKNTYNGQKTTRFYGNECTLIVNLKNFADWTVSQSSRISW